MSDVVIRKLNDVHLKIEAEKSILYELNDEFSFLAPKYQFHPAYKKKLWNGYIHIFSLKSQTIYTGLLKEVREFCEKHSYDIEYRDFEEWPKDTVSIDDIHEFVNELNIHTNGQKLELRDYQYHAIYLILNKLRRIVVSPTSSGKSAIIYVVIRFIQKYDLANNKKTLLVVPSINLVKQMFSDFEDYASEIEWDPKNYCHRIMGGEDKNSDKPIYISTWQSISKEPQSYFDQFGSVIFDETHKLKSDSLRGIAEKLVDCPYRIGLTGTMDDIQTNELVLKGLLGKPKRVISTKELMERNQIAELEIRCIVLQYPKEECKQVRKMEYKEELDYILNHERRNNVVSKLVASKNNNSLVLFSRVDHGKMLEEKIENKYQAEHDVFIVHGEIDGNTREEIRQFAEENQTIIVASYGVFSTGVNIKNIDNVVFSSPMKSKIQVLQSIGRGLRKGRSDKVILYDIVDSFADGKFQNYSLKHFQERLKHYQKEGFTYKLEKVNI